MKHKLKPSATKRLTLNCNILLSASAFSFCFQLLLSASAFSFCFQLLLSASAFSFCFQLLLSASAFKCNMCLYTKAGEYVAVRITGWGPQWMIYLATS